MTRTTDARARLLVLGVLTALAVPSLAMLPACRVSGTPSDGSPAAPRGDVLDSPPELPPDDSLREAPAGDGSLGTCESDDECLFQLDTDCCGLCLAQRDTPPPRRACGTTCPDSPPPCLCVAGKCRTGTLPRNTACDPARDLCSRGLKCCGAVCVLPTMTASGPFCPPPGT
jgi:hypothetical protein